MGPVTDPKRSPDFDVRLGGMNAMRRLAAAGLALAMAFAAASGPVAAQDKAAQDKPAQDKADRYVGYYYPKPAAIEIYKARAAVLPGANRKRRVAFIVHVVNERLQRPYQPTYSLFPKGGRAHKLIIISNLPGQLNTIYRVRALLATMTSVARSLPIFRDHSVEDDFTFLDLMKMLGFESVTVSDGESFTHQIILR
ncbi:MAG: molybdopterin-guanine dinucleotide biosynthesis protein A [Proteobacteria bacterium]|nr:molybdopterin-guanine dinucleotide biosynthesis protein A [Pseudomonadota bacterium]